MCILMQTLLVCIVMKTQVNTFVLEAEQVLLLPWMDVQVDGGEMNVSIHVNNAGYIALAKKFSPECTAASKHYAI